MVDPNYVLSRARHLDGPKLAFDAFAADQAYHIDRQQRHQRLLVAAGVVEGLGVAVSPNDPRLLVVWPGTAVDELGRTILLAETAKVAVEGLASGRAYVEIQFREI